MVKTHILDVFVLDFKKKKGKNAYIFLNFLKNPIKMHIFIPIFFLNSR